MAGLGARRDRWRPWIVIAFAVLLAAGFSELGIWQLQRRCWKLELIAQVEQRVHAVPTAPPEPDDWPQVSARRDAYRHVRVSGVFEPGKATLVQALTELGPGFWVMSPLRTDAGYSILVNRGFVPAELGDRPGPAAEAPVGRETVSGLLRISEPRGGFLHPNRPASRRWYSRDVAAIARADGLEDVAPYFIDADATPNPGGWPRGGLTVVRFPNSHLVYAITWFALATMSLGWGGWAVFEPSRRRRVVPRLVVVGQVGKRRRLVDG